MAFRRRVIVFARAPKAGRVKTRLAAEIGHDGPARTGVDVCPQDEGDLGRRMNAAIAVALAEGVHAVLLVGTDCPDLDAPLLERALEALESADVVLGPTVDGGYYLIGMRHAHAALFDGVPWSSPETLAQTLGAARTSDPTVALLATHTDIDTAEDWQRWVAQSEEAPVLEWRADNSLTTM